MICPGVKRAPLIGSELVSFAPVPLLEGDRDERAAGGAEEGLRGVGGGAGGAMVSCSPLKSLESIVAAAFRSSAPPHVEQKRAFEDACVPQEEQYMGGAILPLGKVWLRTGARALT